eukprot:SAG31_NODE_3617_length_4064_cov_41.284741_3_plen_145_part_00
MVMAPGASPPDDVAFGGHKRHSFSAATPPNKFKTHPGASFAPLDCRRWLFAASAKGLQDQGNQSTFGSRRTAEPTQTGRRSVCLSEWKQAPACAAGCTHPGASFAPRVKPYYAHWPSSRYAARRARRARAAVNMHAHTKFSMIR